MTRLRPSWLALAYAVLYAAGYFSRPVHAAVAIWPAQALGFALFTLTPARRWPSTALALLCGELMLNPLMHWLSGTPQNNAYALFGYASADVLTAFGCAALARGFGLLQPSERYSLIISPLWIPALLIGVAPGSILGALTREHLAGAPFAALDIGLWGLAGVLAIVTMTPAILGILLGYEDPARPVAKPWEGPVVAVLLLGLSLWFAMIPWPALDALLQPMLFTVPLIWLALRFSQRLTNLTVAAVAVGISMLIDYRAASDVWPAHGRSWTDRIASVDLFLMIGCGGALLVNYMIFKQRSLLAELAREHDQLRQYAQALDSAEEAARRATAADLHDGIGQVLAGQSMTLAAMRTHATHPKLLALLEEAIEAAREAQEGLRLMIQDLSPPELDQASLEEILRWLAELFKSRFAFSVEYRIRNDGRLNRDSLQLCYRCIREMLMNSCKHSGRNNASVEVRIEERWMSITVTDEGVGFDMKSAPTVTRGRFGLTQLRERVREAGGSLSLASALGRGCRTTVRLPI